MKFWLILWLLIYIYTKCNVPWIPSRSVVTVMKYFFISTDPAAPLRRWLKCDPAGGGGTAGGGDGWFNLKDWRNWTDELGGPGVFF